jgi:flagellar basal-body rod protein FlgF
VDNGLIIAYSGLKAQSDALEVLANNLANVNTTGFKEDKAFFTVLHQSLNSSNASDTADPAAIPSVLAFKSVNMTEGSLSFTNRDLDLAIEGNGFFTVETPKGIRYTRNGNLRLNAQAVLTTSEGYPLLGTSGRPIKLGPGKIHIGEDGGVSLENAPVDQIKLATFDDMSGLEKEGNSLFLCKGGQDAEKASSAKVKAGYLEESNVNPVSSVIQMVETLRHFESIQKSVSLLMNDIDPKAIDKLGH